MVEGISGVVRVRAQELDKAASQTAVLAMVVMAVVVVVVIRVGVLVAVARILGAHSAPPRGAARRGVASSWWCLGTPGPACSALKTASRTSRATWSFSTR